MNIDYPQGPINTPVVEKKKEKLTPKQAKFIVEYLVDTNARQAAIRAGYSEDSAAVIGCENLTKPNIAREIQKQMDYRIERTLITADSVLARMDRVAERCMQALPVMVFNKEKGEWEQLEDEEGRAVYQFDSAGANKALENLARNQKLLTDKTELAGHDGGALEAPIIKRVYVASKEAAAQEMDQSLDGQ